MALRACVECGAAFDLNTRGNRAITCGTTCSQSRRARKLAEWGRARERARPGYNREKVRRWRETHPDYDKGEGRREYFRQYRQENRQVIIERNRRWRAQKTEVYRQRARRYRAKSRHVTRVRELRRRARLLAATSVPFTAEELQARLGMYAGCWICGGSADEVDHVKPLAKGGPNMLANMRPICSRCNRLKWDRWPYQPVVRRLGGSL